MMHSRFFTLRNKSMEMFTLWCYNYFGFLYSVGGGGYDYKRFDKISVSTKLKRNAALAYPFDTFAGYEFEAYGVEDYLADFYHAGQTIQEMKDNIRGCDEQEVGFSFVFPFDIEGKQVFEFVKLLRREGFYY